MPYQLTQQRNLNYINVKDYGAQGDGVTDDTTALTAAINAVNAAGGGTVFFPAGTYLHTGLFIYSKVQYVGAGVDATVLKLKNGANTDCFAGTVNGYGGVMCNVGAANATGSTGGVYSWSIRDLTIDGNKTNQSGTSYGIHVYGYAFLLSNIKVRFCLTSYMLIDWNGGSTVTVGDGEESRMVNVEMIGGCGGIGFDFGGPHDIAMTNVLCGQSTNTAFHIGPNATGVLTVNCHGWGMTSGDPSWLIEGVAFQGVNNVSEGRGAPHVVILANKVSWMSSLNYIFGSNYSSSGVQIGQKDTAVLHAATGALTTLTTQPYSVAPTAYLSFVVTGAGASGNFAITGTDILDNAISENLAASGNGTFQSVLAYKTASVVVTGLAGYSVVVNGIGKAYTGSVAQSSGVTTVVQPYGWTVLCGFADCAGPNGAVWFANDGGGGFVEGPVTQSGGAPGAIAYGPTTGTSYHPSSYVNLVTSNITGDGTAQKGGIMHIGRNSPSAFNIGNGTNDRLNVNTFNGRFELPGNMSLIMYSDQYSTKTTQLINGTLCLLQSTSAAATATSGTITTSGVGVARVAPTGNITAVVLQAGTISGQIVRVVNESAFTVTFDIQTNSHVADGASAIIAANRFMDFVWDSGVNLWFHS